MTLYGLYCHKNSDFANMTTNWDYILLNILILTQIQRFESNEIEDQFLGTLDLCDFIIFFL